MPVVHAAEPCGPPVLRKVVILKGLKVLCFDNLLQVFILLGLQGQNVCFLVTPPSGPPKPSAGRFETPGTITY